MPHSSFQLNAHLIFSTRKCEPVINDQIRADLHAGWCPSHKTRGRINLHSVRSTMEDVLQFIAIGILSANLVFVRKVNYGGTRWS